MTGGGAWTAVVLAGSRGPDDPLARATGRLDKALIEVAGVPMVERVVRALAACPRVGRIRVAIREPEALTALPALAALRSDGRLAVLRAAGSPSGSVLAAIEGVDGPVLVTTGDSALLTPDMVGHFLDAVPAGVDAAAAVARAATVEAVRRGVRRTYLRFSDDAYSGCNLFALTTPRARRAVAFWQRVEGVRKRPLAMIRELGPAALMRFALGRLSLRQALDVLEARCGARIAAVDMPFGTAAIDVDTPADLDLVRELLSDQRQAPTPSG